MLHDDHIAEREVQVELSGLVLWNPIHGGHDHAVRHCNDLPSVGVVVLVGFSFAHVGGSVGARNDEVSGSPLTPVIRVHIHLGSVPPQTTDHCP